MTLTGNLLDLPTELVLAVFHCLEIVDVLNLRLCCRRLNELSKERVVWVDILRRQQETLPKAQFSAFFSKEEYHSDEFAFQHAPVASLEHIATTMHRVSVAWALPRIVAAGRIERRDNANFLGIDIFLDRWLLVVYAEGKMDIFDLLDTGSPAPVPRETLVVEDTAWGSYSASLGETGRSLFVAVAEVSPNLFLEVYEIEFAEASTSQSDISVSFFNRVRRLPLDSPKLLRAISPSLSLVAFSGASVVELINWNSVGEDTLERASIKPAYVDDPEFLWNGIVALRFVGPYLIAKTRSLELHHYGTTEDRPPPFKHYFEHKTFREVTFSYPRLVEQTESQKTLEFTMLGSDVIQGLFQFLVKIQVPIANPTPDDTYRHVPQDSMHPQMEIDLIGVYPMSLAIAPPSSSASSSRVGRSSGVDTPTPVTSHNPFLHGFGPFGHKSPASVSRGFLSTFCIGPEGKRAIWVERARSSIGREVQVWDHNMRATSNRILENWAEHLGPNCVEIEKKVILKVSSYDLRDDITHCAFGEGLGTIVLGTRSGNMHVLPVLQP